MNILEVSSKKRETYQVEIEYSLLWESALGIAAITNTPLIDTLEKMEVFTSYKKDFSTDLLKELKYVEQNNTWKSLLQLLHSYEVNCNDIEKFKIYLNDLPEVRLKYICLPYLGVQHQERRELAARGDRESIQLMKALANNNNFLPAYIEYISQVNIIELKEHLINVLSMWYGIVNHDKADQLLTILKRDAEEKKRVKEKFTSEEFVTWATRGIDYSPEPSVYKVILIPQITYRPWTIIADIEETKVFYYPVPEENINPDDPYLPNDLLIQKHKALGDEVRLRMIKLLSKRDRTLQEITENLELGKSTVHHHLKILRSATLVDVIDAKYCLKEKSLNYLSKELDLYLNK